MAGRRLMTLDVRELIHRLREGEPHRAIARDLGMARKTVARYHGIAREQGWLEGPLIPALELERHLAGLEVASLPRPPIFKATPYRERIEALRSQGVEMRAIFQRLQADGYTGSYSSLYRFVRHLEPSVPDAFCRIETPPAEEAQVDFGYAGMLKDRSTGKLRKTWFFVMTLSYSRHQYVRFVFDQTIETWLRCQRLAFEAFGGVVRRVVVDNLKAAIVKAVLYDPVAQRSYREFAEHYGFLISPCRPGTPEHKGKVESGVRYVKRNFLAGRDDLQDLVDANAKVEVWVERIAGQRIHGTTGAQPLVQFLETEQAVLETLPAAPYDMGVWKKAKVHPDCHVSIDGAFYSAPHRLIGQRLWVRCNRHDVVLYHEYERIATHRWGPKGTRRTDPAHYPPYKVATLMATPQWCREKAERIGPATSEIVHELLAERPLDRLRTVQAILRLEGKYGAVRLEAACRRARLFGELRHATIKRILDLGLENDPIDETRNSLSHEPSTQAAPATDYVFARPGSEIFGLIETGGTDHGHQAPVDPQAQSAASLRHLGDVGRA